MFGFGETKKDVPKVLDGAVSKKQWNRLIKEDPSLEMFALSPWQNTNVVFQSDDLEETVKQDGEGKDSKPEWRELQTKCWNKYRTFGPINASINSKSDYTAGSGFSLYSPVHKISRFLNDLWYSHRNQLYFRGTGWVTRMQAEGELFLLLAFDKDGKATVRAFEPSRIGNGSNSDNNTGLITNPDDFGETLFYEIGDQEIIPDINIMYDPSKEKKVSGKISADKLKGSKATVNKRKFKKMGGYRRFIIHWKNMSGIMEYARDTSQLSAILEAINLYWNAIKWQLDHKKAATSYTNVFKFNETAAGKLAWHIFKKMTSEEKEAFGLTKRLTPGSKIFMMPGMEYDVKSPQMSKLDGDNRDLLNIAGSGAESPQDMFQGDVRGSTFSSLSASRSPLEINIENMQHKFSHFIQYNFLRACFYAAHILDDFPTTFEKEFVDHEGGKEEIIKDDVEPSELVEVITPHVKFESDLQGKVSAYLGNNHEGVTSVGVSDERAARVIGVKDFNRERDKRLIEDSKKKEIVPVEEEEEEEKKNEE